MIYRCNVNFTQCQVRSLRVNLRKTKMRVIVFGATGSIGHLTVQELLKEGHEVTAFARNPQKLGQNYFSLIEYCKFMLRNTTLWSH